MLRGAGIVGLLILWLAWSLDGSRAEDRPQPLTERPRLAVIVVFDQLRGDFLPRWRALFGEGGFERLMSEGAWFPNCHYRHATTNTGPGHATIATGTFPQRHGIISNDWYERSEQASVNCVQVTGAAAERAARVPPAETLDDDEEEPARPRPASKPRGYSPERLRSPTLADALKTATQGTGRVVSISFKDRSAILPAGRSADLCCWLGSDTGTFVTSRFYRERLPQWVAEYNASRPADRWFGTIWDRLRPDVNYDCWAGPDDVEAEGLGTFQGRTFPHPLGFPPLLVKSYYGALYNSPFGNELLLDFAKKAIVAEKLGQDDVPDLLCVSFSSNDAVGHCYGPDSHEVLDTTLRSDRTLRELLIFLDEYVGKGRYVLALTADHGICPLPEVAKLEGKDAARISPLLVDFGSERMLQERFGKDSVRGKWIEARSGFWYYLNRETIQRAGADPREVERALADWLKARPGVERVWTRSQLAEKPDDPIGQAVWRTFHPDRCGEVYVVVKPYYLPLVAKVGTTHGTPHDYDTHVPLILFGAGIRRGVFEQRVGPEVIAGALAEALGIAPPGDAEPVSLETLLRNAP
ncbi:MAG: alkaline phosphatase family protein [Gemmatales bacterium]|nr:alkaline phosphatase family protein [Gemmatales bacterium]MDW8388131.1 alkaline phosphatase family protein [Gemmatales bacterium]